MNAWTGHTRNFYAIVFKTSEMLFSNIFTRLTRFTSSLPQEDIRIPASAFTFFGQMPF